MVQGPLVRVSRLDIHRAGARRKLLSRRAVRSLSRVYVCSVVSGGKKEGERCLNV